jgi:hypothetical protein
MQLTLSSQVVLDLPPRINNQLNRTVGRNVVDIKSKVIHASLFAGDIQHSDSLHNRIRLSKNYRHVHRVGRD